MIFPADAQVFKTQGEARVYTFLRDVPKPDDRYIVWYAPDLKGLEPDFLLYSKDIGLVVLEVKDWALDQIVEADREDVTVLYDGKPTRVRNPMRQARDYATALMEILQKDGRLISRDPTFYGKCRVPISCGVVFTNINKFEFEQSDISSVIEPHKVFFWDDLHPQSELCADLSGQKFARVLESKFPPLFPCRLSASEATHLRALIFPTFRVETPDRGQIRDVAEQLEHIRCLDHHQEGIARRCEGGLQVLRGPSGSGKTLVLVHRAVLLLKKDPRVKRVLILCYNITLPGFIRRLLAAKGVPLGPAGVEVMHFYELCSKILGEPIAYENEDSEFYSLVAAEAAEKARDCGLKFDAVLVDEGQDFSTEMVRTALGVLAEGSDHFMIAMDEGQTIYPPRRALSEIAAFDAAKVHHLSCPYRSTRELAVFAEQFLGREAEDALDGLRKAFLLHGPGPDLVQCPDYAAVCGEVAERVRALLDTGFPAAEIAVLYASSRTEEGFDIPRTVMDRLHEKGVLTVWASEDSRSKRDYDVSIQRVAVSTIHSVKGLDYACVFLLGIDLLGLRDLSKEQKRKLTYVGISRARYRLVIPYVEETTLIARLKAAAETQS
jgi:hypothetical protein